MAPRRFRNPLQRFFYKLGHEPFELVEAIPFGLLLFLFWSCLKGAGGFLEYGSPMAGVSYIFLCLAGVHALVVLLRRKSRGVDAYVLMPLPFVVLILIHSQILSPFPWATDLVLVLCLQAYGLYLIVLNSIRDRKTALWTIVVVELIIVAAVLIAFRQFYLSPGGGMMPGRVRYPGYAHGMAGYLQDPQTVASLVLLLWPMTLMMSWMRRFPTIVRVANAFCAAFFPVMLILCSNQWGLVVFLLQFLAMPIFLSGEGWIRRRLWAYGSASLVVSLGVLWFFADGLQQRMRYLADGDFALVDMGLQTGWRQFMEAPILGQGMGTFASLWDRFNPVWSMDSSLSSGSFLLDILAGSGILGILLLAGPFLILMIRAIPVWQSKLHVVYNEDVVRRFRHLPSRKRFRNKLVREQSRTPSSKIFLGGLFPGLAGLLLYQAGDYSLRLPLHVFLTVSLIAFLAVIGRRYKPFPDNGISGRCLGLVPLGIAIACCLVGIPRFKGQHLEYTATERLEWLVSKPERIFSDPAALDSVESDFQRAVEFYPGHAGAWIGLSRARLARLMVEQEAPGDIARRARASLEEARLLSPMSWEIPYLMARVDIMLGKPVEKVIPDLKRAHELAPRRPEPLAFLGMLLLWEDRQSSEGHALVASAYARYPEYSLLRLFSPWVELSGDQAGDRVDALGDGSLVTAEYIARKFIILPTLHESIRGAGLQAGLR